MTLYIIVYKEYKKPPRADAWLYASPDEALGRAMLTLDTIMSSAGFQENYHTLCLYRQGDSLNLTAVSDRREGYPEKLVVDAYVMPLAIEQGFELDFEGGT